MVQYEQPQDIQNQSKSWPIYKMVYECSVAAPNYMPIFAICRYCFDILIERLSLMQTANWPHMYVCSYLLEIY